MKIPVFKTPVLQLLLVVIATLPPAHSLAERLFERSVRNYFETPFQLTDSSTVIFEDDEITQSVEQLDIDLRVAMQGIEERRGLAAAYWGVELIGEGDTLSLSVRHGNSDFGDILDRRLTFVTLNSRRGKLAEAVSEKFAASSGSFNSLHISFSRQNHTIKVTGGGSKPEMLLKSDLPFTPEKITLWSKGRMDVAALVTEKSFDPEEHLDTGYSFEQLRERFSQSIDPAEGFWQYLDRENDTRYAHPGGRYLLATVKSDSGSGYDIIYLDGAITLANKWRPGMLKGRLKPTIFRDHFDLQWIDSTFDSIDTDIHADITDSAILTLSFPLLKTKLRFSKATAALLGKNSSLKTAYYEKSQADQQN